MSHKADELSSQAAQSVHDVATKVLSSAASIKLSHEGAAGLLDSIDSASKAQLLIARRRRRRLTASSNATSSVDVSATEMLLKSFSHLASSDMVAGQAPVVAVKSQFSMATSVLSSSSSSSASINIPLSAAETLAGKRPPSISLGAAEAHDNSSSSTTVSLVSMSAKMYNNPLFNSNPLQIHYSNLPGSIILIVLQNNAPVNYVTPSYPHINTTCGFDDYSVHQYPCVEGDPIFVFCNGSAITYTNRCPQTSIEPSCNSVTGASSSSSGCTVFAYNEHNTTCSCPIPTMSRRALSGGSTSTN
jgi:hypothetical protein